MLSTWLYSLLAVFIVSLISFVGIFTFALNSKKLQKILLFLVSFSAGALLGDAFIHLIPEIISATGFTLYAALATLG
jgi:zinc and cadmium transporter